VDTDAIRTVLPCAAGSDLLACVTRPTRMQEGETMHRNGSVHMTQDTCGKQVLPSRF
jgi:hypothetical protein